MWRCLTTEPQTIRRGRLLWLLGLALALLVWAAPHAAADAYDDTLDRLARLQDLAETYAAETYRRARRSSVSS